MAEFDRRFKAFIPPHSKELNCSICLGLFFDRVQFRCHHVFCRDCIEEWLNDHESCPQCRQEVSESSLEEAPAAIVNQILNLEVQCINRAKGCSEKTRLEDYQSHIADACPYQMTECGNDRCEEMLRKDKASHDTECEYSLIDCPECGVREVRSRKSRHRCMGPFEQWAEQDRQEAMKLCEEYERHQAEEFSEVRSQKLMLTRDALKQIDEFLQCINNVKQTQSEYNAIR